MAENGLQNGQTSNVGNYINNMGLYIIMHNITTLQADLGSLINLD